MSRENDLEAALIRAAAAQTRAECERDELQELLKSMKFAASTAADTAATAIGRLQQMDAVVKAAQAWRMAQAKSGVEYGRVVEDLVEKVDAYTRLERSRS